MLCGMLLLGGHRSATVACQRLRSHFFFFFCFVANNSDFDQMLQLQHLGGHCLQSPNA